MVRLAKHAAHISVTRIIYLVGELELKRPLEIPRLLLKDNIKTDLREKLYENVTGLEQDPFVSAF